MLCSNLLLGLTVTENGKENIISKSAHFRWKIYYQLFKLMFLFIHVSCYINTYARTHAHTYIHGYKSQ